MEIASAALVALSLILGTAGELTEPPAIDIAKTKRVTYCAYFTGGQHMSYCTSQPVAEATKACNERLKKQGIEGTCSCTDDPGFIGDRCG